MTTVILDTNIVSYFMKSHSLAEKYRPHLEGRTAAISFMTVAELFEGGYRRGWSDERFSHLREHLRKYMIVPYTQKIVETYARIRAARMHQPIAVDDAWIAATALAKDCPLVTHNPGDFADISDLKIITELR